MSQSRFAGRAEDAARKLAAQLRNPLMTQSLQQAPPETVLWNKQQARQLGNCFHELQLLFQALQEAEYGTADAVQALDAVLQQQAAESAGTLIRWMQQRPEQLFSMVTARQQLQGTHRTNSGLTVPNGVWHLSVAVLKRMLGPVMSLDSSRTSTHRLTATITDQLQQSGELQQVTFV
jgi:hypothetical protein